MFDFAWNNYLNYGYPSDGIHPLTCTSVKQGDEDYFGEFLLLVYLCLIQYYDFLH